MDKQAGEDVNKDPSTDWTQDAVVVGFDAAGHAAFWPAGRALPASWTRAHGPCGIEAARRWIEDPANLPESLSAPAPDVDHESIPARLARLALEAPDRPAVLFGGETLTRGDLDARAAAIAAGLAAGGIGRGQRVAVALERTPEIVSVLLGILRAGAAFLPLDPEYPAARIHMMLEDAGITQCVTTPEIAARLDLPPGITRRDPAALAVAAPVATAPPMPEPGDPAYLIYTSGSTGRP